jgi:hypothetical protein
MGDSVILCGSCFRHQSIQHRLDTLRLIRAARTSRDVHVKGPAVHRATANRNWCRNCGLPVLMTPDWSDATLEAAIRTTEAKLG